MRMNMTTQLDTTTLQQFLHKSPVARFNCAGPRRAKPFFGLAPFAGHFFSLKTHLHRGLQADVLDLVTAYSFLVVINDFTTDGQAAERRPEYRSVR